MKHLVTIIGEYYTNNPEPLKASLSCQVRALHRLYRGFSGGRSTPIQSGTDGTASAIYSLNTTTMPLKGGVFVHILPG